VRHPFLLQHAPHERLVVDHLGPSVELGPVEQVEHVGSDDGRRGCVPAEHDGATDRLRLDPDVVVQELHETALRPLQRLGHGAGEAAGAAQIGLLDHPESGAEGRGEVRVFGPVGHALCALVDDEDPVDEFEHVGGVGEAPERVDTVVGLVVRRDADRRLALAHGVLLRRPLSALEDDVLRVGDDVEPDPPPVAVLIEHEVDARRAVSLDLVRRDTLPDAGAVRPVDKHGGLP